MIGNFIRSYFIITVVLFLTIWFLPNVDLGFQVGAAFTLEDFIRHLPVLLTTSLVLTILSIIARPILEFVTAPINWITLGLFNVIINMGFFYLATYLVPDFVIRQIAIGDLQLHVFFSYATVAIFFGFVQGFLALIF